MNQKQKNEITQIAQQFAEPFYVMFGSINGSGIFIVDPLSGYLNFGGYTHNISELPATDLHPQVLVLEFPDGSQFIPAGEDLKPLHAGFHNWMWID